jgi:CRISPR/Cas system CSM-associated protein Csm3 (group 7 of RAMP superfamily)
MIRTDRIQICYTLEFSSLFHCGTGVREGLIDRSVMRDGGQYLYVPGSTIKGVVRELCEQLARFYEDSDEDLRKRIASPHDKAIALSDLGSKPTLVTRIFGSQIRPGHLFFNDARQTKEDKERYDTSDKADKKNGAKRYQSMQTDLYTQVRLDRPTRTAVRGALYSSEFGVRKMTFQGSIVGVLECIPLVASVDELFSGKLDEPSYSLLLLLAGLYMVDRLGGNKSTGKGECHCTITELKLNGTMIKSDQWENWVQHHLQMLSYYSLMLEEEEA